MPIVQERLITLIEITERALDVTKQHKRIAQNLSLEIQSGRLLSKLLQADGMVSATKLVEAWLMPYVNMILDHQMSPEDFMNFREEQIHFKYTANKNKNSRHYAERYRNKQKLRKLMESEDIGEVNQYDEIAEAVLTAKKELDPKYKSEEKESKPEIETETNGDLSREEYERERDARLARKNSQLIGRVGRSDDGETS